MAVWMWVQIGLYAATTGIQYYQSRQATKERIDQGERELVDAPYVTESDPIPVVFGTAWIAAPNVIYRGRQQYVPEESSIIAGSEIRSWLYKDWYYAICHGPVDFWSARYGDDRLLEAVGGAFQFPTGTTEYRVRKESNIADNSGRWDHYVRVLPGTLTQTATITHATPGILTEGFPGLCYAYARIHSVGGDDQTGRPPHQPVSFRVQRIAARWQRQPTDPRGTYALAGQLDPGTAQIGDDMNPMHIIREVLIDPVWGMDLGLLCYSSTSFSAAGATLVAENFGLSFVWAKETSAADFIQEVLRHIDGLLYVEPTTGLFHLSLLRSGSGTLHDLTSPSDHIAPPTYSRPSFRDVANKVTVTYSSPTLGRERSTTVINSALALSLGEIPSTSSYPGISNDALAAKVAGRDLQRLSTPLARVSITTTWARGSGIRPGDRVSFAWAPYGIAAMSLRVLSVGFGELGDSSVSLDCIEDVYATTAALFGTPGASTWTPPEDTPVAPPRQLALQLPLAFARYVGVGVDSASTGFWPMFAAESPNDIHVGFDFTINNVRVTPLGRSLTQTRTLATNLAAVNGITEQIVDLTSPFTGLVVGQRYLAYLGVELVELRWTGSDTRVWRGRYDTVPFYTSSTVAYLAGTRVWLLGAIGSDQVVTPMFATQNLERTATIACRALTRTSTRILPPASAISTNLAAVAGGNRTIRPYNLGHLETTMGPAGATFFWRRRNRLTQPDAYQNSPTITPETGTTHRIRIEYLNGATWTVVPSMASLGYVELAITTVSYSYTAITEENDYIASGLPPGPKTFDNLRAQCYTVRDGIESWQRHFRYRV